MDIQPIIQAVQQAVILCREVQHKFLVSSAKLSHGEAEPVTIADYGAQAIICRTIRQHYPDDGVLAEEQGQQFLDLVDDEHRAHILQLLMKILDEPVTQEDVVTWLDHGANKSDGRTWVIDPIDGTKGFINMRHYAIAVGLVENGVPIAGAMACPGYGDGVSGYDEDGALFYAHDGAAYMRPIGLSGQTDVTPITVSSRTDSSELRIVQSFEKQHASKDRMARLRELADMADASVSELDSMEKYALVANGDADLYMRLPNMDSTRPHLSWDHAAGAAIVLAAGGSVTDVDGTPLKFGGKILPNKGMLVSNGHVHDRVVKAAIQLLNEEA